MHSSWRWSLLNNGARLWNTEYCNTIAISDIGWFVVTEPSLFCVAECRVHMHGSSTSYHLGGLGRVQCSLTISDSRVRAVRLASPTVSLQFSYLLACWCGYHSLRRPENESVAGGSHVRLN